MKCRSRSTLMLTICHRSPTKVVGDFLQTTSEPDGHRGRTIADSAGRVARRRLRDSSR